MIRIGIMGYGNLGRGIECAIKQNDDLELVAVFTRRDPATVSILTEGAAVCNVKDVEDWKDKIDVLAKKVVQEGMPVRKVEALVGEMNAKKPQKKVVKKSAFIRASETQLSDKFGASVSISENKKGKGHLSIDFASADELNRILDLLGVDLDG